MLWLQARGMQRRCGLGRYAKVAGNGRSCVRKLMPAAGPLRKQLMMGVRVLPCSLFSEALGRTFALAGLTKSAAASALTLMLWLGCMFWKLEVRSHPLMIMCRSALMSDIVDTKGPYMVQLCLEQQP